MSETTNPNNSPATSALQVVIELIRAGDLKTNATGDGEIADKIVRAHTQLTNHFKEMKKG